jgi:hypothetical protein
MWFWLCILALFTLSDFLIWLVRLIIPSNKLNFIKRHLDVHSLYSNSSTNERLNKHNQKTTGQANEFNELNNKTRNFEMIDVQKEKKLIREFTFNYLKDDGIFAMRLLSMNASDLMVTEIISELWKNFRYNYVDKSSLVEVNNDMTILSTHSSSSSSSSTSHLSPNRSPLSSPSSIISNTVIKQPLNPNVNLNSNYMQLKKGTQQVKNIY